MDRFKFHHFMPLINEAINKDLSEYIDELLNASASSENHDFDGVED